ARLEPGERTVQRAPLKTLIERVDADGQTLQSPWNIPSPPQALTFHYSAPAMVDAHSIEFRYRFNATEKWIEVAGNRLASLTKPRGGDYRFQVQTRFAGEPWVEPAAALDFRIEPAFHETPWFLGALAAGLLALGLGGHRIYLRIIRAREKELRALVGQQTAQLQEAVQKLEVLSAMDAMTHLPNRRRLDALLRLEWQRAYRSRSLLTVLMIDVDHFKLYNDSLGHQAGDQCLIAISAALEQELRRAGDWVGRYGGEEFLAVLPGDNVPGALVVAERVRERIRALAIRHPASPTAEIVTVSIGAATGIPSPNVPTETFVKIADEALYRAKENGRDCTVHRNMMEDRPPEGDAG
nr:diguanylate cyclase [Pseudomonadota bacterium]